MVLFQSAMAVWKLLWQKLVKHMNCNKVLLESQNLKYLECSWSILCLGTGKKSPEESKSLLKSAQSARLIQHRPGDGVSRALIPMECQILCKSWDLFVPEFQRAEWSWFWAGCVHLCSAERISGGLWGWWMSVVLLCLLMLPEPTKIWNFLLPM